MPCVLTWMWSTWVEAGSGAIFRKAGSQGCYDLSLLRDMEGAGVGWCGV